MRPLCLLAALALAFPEASAQIAPSAFPRPGTPVRVTDTKSDTTYGLIVGFSPDSLWLSQRRLSRTEVATVATQRRNHAKGAIVGLKWGAGIGGLMLLGGVIADATAEPCRDFICIPAAAVGAFMGVVSTGVGTILGAAIGQREWQAVK
jgi:hypothetical protein